MRRKSDRLICGLALVAILLNLAMTVGVAYVAYRIGSVLRKVDLDRACEKAGYSQIDDRPGL